MSIREKITQAGRELKLIRVKASKIDGSITERTCEPYSIKTRGTGDIFHFYCLLRNGWRSLRLNLIFEVEILDEYYSPRVEVEF